MKPQRKAIFHGRWCFNKIKDIIFDFPKFVRPPTMWQVLAYVGLVRLTDQKWRSILLKRLIWNAINVLFCTLTSNVSIYPLCLFFWNQYFILLNNSISLFIIKIFVTVYFSEWSKLYSGLSGASNSMTNIMLNWFCWPKHVAWTSSVFLRWRWFRNTVLP